MYNGPNAYNYPDYSNYLAATNIQAQMDQRVQANLAGAGANTAVRIQMPPPPPPADARDRYFVGGNRTGNSLTGGVSAATMVAVGLAPALITPSSNQATKIAVAGLSVAALLLGAVTGANPTLTYGRCRAALVGTVGAALAIGGAVGAVVWYDNAHSYFIDVPDGVSASQGGPRGPSSDTLAGLFCGIFAAEAVAQAAAGFLFWRTSVTR